MSFETFTFAGGYLLATEPRAIALSSIKVGVADGNAGDTATSKGW